MNCVVLCCALLFRYKGGMFTICWMITSATLHCIFVLCIQNHLLRFGLPSYNRHMSCATKSFIEKMRGLETSAGCLSSGVLCGWSSSQLGSCLSSSFSSHPSPSCGTCGGRRSPIHCGMVMVGKQEGHLPSFRGWPWKSLCSCYRLCHCWACHPRLRQTSGRQA